MLQKPIAPQRPARTIRSGTKDAPCTRHPIAARPLSLPGRPCAPISALAGLLSTTETHPTAAHAAVEQLMRPQHPSESLPVRPHDPEPTRPQVTSRLVPITTPRQVPRRGLATSSSLLQ